VNLSFLILVGFLAGADTQTYTGQITKIDQKARTITIKGPRPGLIPDQSAPPRGRGGAAAPPAGSRGRRGGGSATPRGPDMRAYEDVETKIVWTEATEVESMDGKLELSDLKVGDYLLIDTVKDGKKIRATRIKRTTAAGG
jgi:hypothetical protein